MIMGDYAHQNIGEYQNVYVNLDLSNIYELEFAPPRRTWGNRGGFEGRYGLVDKTHPSCVRPGLNTRVQH